MSQNPEIPPTTPAAERDRHRPDPSPEGPESREMPGTPEAVEARLATRKPDSPEAEQVAGRRGSVEWVHASDLASRGGAGMLHEGMKLNKSLAAAVHDAARSIRPTLAKKVAERETDLETTSPERTTRRGPGREGVSL